MVTNGYAAHAWPSQPGNRIEGRRLSRSRGAKQCSDAAVEVFVELENESALLKREVERDHALRPAREVM